jgi:hypothetical protein
MDSGRGTGGWRAQQVRRASRRACYRCDVAGDDQTDDPDRAAILARRRRFIALAISGLASCKSSEPEVHVCLSPEITPDRHEERGSEVFIEDPGAPLGETGETGGDETGEALEQPYETPPEVCLKVAPPQPKPRACLRKASPKPCLMVL